MESVPKKMIVISKQLEKEFVEAFEKMQEVLFRINEDRGWHDPVPSDAEATLTVHEEAAELGRHFRDNPEAVSTHLLEHLAVEEEGADIVIRVMSWFKRKKWNLATAIVAKAHYNTTRPHRHGGKRF